MSLPFRLTGSIGIGNAGRAAIRPQTRRTFLTNSSSGSSSSYRNRIVASRSAARELTTSSSSSRRSSRDDKSKSGKKRSYGRYAPLLAVPLAILPLSTLSADSDNPSTSSGIQSTPTSSLLRTYFVYTLISIPGIVDYAPSLLHYLTHTSIPLIGTMTEMIVRQTFFAQFVGGESALDCLGTMDELREKNVGTMLNYSAEAEETPSVSGKKEKEDKEREEREMRLKEVFDAIDALGQFERKLDENERGSSSFALKVTGLIDPPILGRASTTLLRLRPLTSSLAPSSPNTPLFVPFPGAPQSSDSQILARSPSSSDGRLLSLKGIVEGMGVLDTDEGLRPGDLEELRGLWEKLLLIGKKAQEKGIPLLVDAEYTGYQPALDAYTLLLSAEFNKPPSSFSQSKSKSNRQWHGPLIYGTYQSYLIRQPAYLNAMLKHAQENDYALGIKLVRGAYVEQERKRWKVQGREGVDPIWPSKPATDLAYNDSITTILSTLSAQLASPKPELSLSVIFGTHNSDSCDLIMNGLRNTGLATEDESKRLRLREDVEGKIGIAQLYGMKNDLTDRVASSIAIQGRPLAIKYVPYGKLSEVIPYLGRRAIENKSLMSGDEGAGAECRRVRRELWRRLWA